MHGIAPTRRPRASDGRSIRGDVGATSGGHADGRFATALANLTSASTESCPPASASLPVLSGAPAQTQPAAARRLAQRGETLIPLECR